MISRAGSGVLADVDAPVKARSDLKTRTLTAIVMVLVAGGALVLGGLAWTVFVFLVSAGVLWEWMKLSQMLARRGMDRWAWYVCGLAYVGLAGEMLLRMRALGALAVLVVVGAVVATDVGAYFAGRTFGGPKIAPRISPSKTWAGLAGGMIAATAAVAGMLAWVHAQEVGFYHQFHGLALPPEPVVWVKALWGAGIAVVAQAGDFFESWMKRRAGVKDSGRLLPGHGGLFDRVDGLLAVCFVIALWTLAYSVVLRH